MKVAVMTDTTAYIPEDVREKYNIHIVPLSVVFGDESFREEFDITTEEFYNKVRESDKLPSTSQPAIGEVVSMFETLAAEHDAVVAIHISSKLSGTFQATESDAKMVDNLAVYSFDSEISAMAQGFYVLEAAERVAAGDTPEKVMAHLENMRDHVRAYFMVDDLSHLQRGGRLS